MRYYHFNGVFKRISRKDPHDKWYYAFVDSGQEHDLDVDTNEAAANALTIFINFRVQDFEGQLLGVTGVGMRMDQVARLLTQTQQKYNRLIYLVDPRGAVQAHSDKSLVGAGSITNMPGVSAIADRILAARGAPAIFEYDVNDTHALLTVRYIPELDWFLLVEQDEGAPGRSPG